MAAHPRAAARRDGASETSATHRSGVRAAAIVRAATVASPARAARRTGSRVERRETLLSHLLAEVVADLLERLPVRHRLVPACGGGGRTRPHPPAARARRACAIERAAVRARARERGSGGVRISGGGARRARGGATRRPAVASPSHDRGDVEPPPPRLFSLARRAGCLSRSGECASEPGALSRRWARRAVGGGRGGASASSHLSHSSCSSSSSL